MAITHTARSIAVMNDQFRRQRLHADQSSRPIPGRIILTNGIAGLPELARIEILRRVGVFNDFADENDPYGEHDFGSFTYNTDTIIWKIDYYAPDMEHGSADPTDREQTVRVLTIMLAHEY